MARRKLRSAQYSLDDFRNLHAEGKISDRQYRRAGGICADHINDNEYQSDAVRATGLPKTQQYGPADAGHIDARANKKQHPKESRTSTYQTDWFRSREARVQPTGNMYDVPGRN
jgi:hypothetical protein